MPSKEIFSDTKFSSSIVNKRMKELAFLNKGIKITIIDNISSKPKEIINKYDGGINEFVEFLDDKREKLVNKNSNNLFKKPISVEGSKNKVVIECALKWNAGYNEDILAFTNNIHQRDGGTHLLGFRSALTRVINKYASDNNLLKKKQSFIIWRRYKRRINSCFIN